MQYGTLTFNGGPAGVCLGASGGRRSRRGRSRRMRSRRPRPRAPHQPAPPHSASRGSSSSSSNRGAAGRQHLPSSLLSSRCCQPPPPSSPRFSSRQRLPTSQLSSSQQRCPDSHHLGGLRQQRCAGNQHLNSRQQQRQAAGGWRQAAAAGRRPLLWRLRGPCWVAAALLLRHQHLQQHLQQRGSMLSKRPRAFSLHRRRRPPAAPRRLLSSSRSSSRRRSLLQRCWQLSMGSSNSPATAHRGQHRLSSPSQRPVWSSSQRQGQRRRRQQPARSLRSRPPKPRRCQSCRCCQTSQSCVPPALALRWRCCRRSRRSSSSSSSSSRSSSSPRCGGCPARRSMGPPPRSRRCRLGSCRLHRQKGSCRLRRRRRRGQSCCSCQNRTSSGLPAGGPPSRCRLHSRRGSNRQQQERSWCRHRVRRPAQHTASHLRGCRRASVSRCRHWQSAGSRRQRGRASTSRLPQWQQSICWPCCSSSCNSSELRPRQPNSARQLRGSTRRLLLQNLPLRGSSSCYRSACPAQRPRRCLSLRRRRRGCAGCPRQQLRRSMPSRRHCPFGKPSGALRRWQSQLPSCSPQTLQQRQISGGSRLHELRSCLLSLRKQHRLRSSRQQASSARSQTPAAQQI